MKKFYLFMTMALALFVGASVAWARLNPGYDAMTEVKDGDQFFIKGEYQNGNGGNPLDHPRWLGVQRPRIGEEDELIVRAYKDNVNAGDAFVFTAETAGTEIKGYPAFYLKNNLTGKYLAKSEEEAAAYESAIFLTEDKTIAAVCAFVPVNETVTADDAVVPENVLHMVTLANDGTWVYFNNNYNGNNNTWTPRVASWTDGTTWCTLYPAEVEADEEEAAISDLAELYQQATIYYGIDGVMGGTEPGYYPESVAIEFNAANMRDIGYHFPDNAAETDNIDSKILLRRTIDLIATKGYHVGNIDATVCTERPKLNTHIPAMQQCLAHVMGIDPDSVSIKATTTERLGFTGRQEGISAYAVCLIQRP